MVGVGVAGQEASVSAVRKVMKLSEGVRNHDRIWDTWTGLDLPRGWFGG